jgi:hypothetical protein
MGQITENKDKWLFPHIDPVRHRPMENYCFEGAKKMKNYLTISILACLAFTLILTGCEKKVNENTPIADVKAAADKMDKDQLKSAAMEYKNAITAKKAEVDKIMAQIKQVPPTEIMGDKMKNLKSQLDPLSKSLTGLQERFDIIVSKLKEKGGDLSGLTL